MKKETNSKHEISPDNSDVNEQNIFDVPLRNLSPEIRKTMQKYIDDKAKYLNLEGKMHSITIVRFLLDNGDILLIFNGAHSFFTR